MGRKLTKEEFTEKAKIIHDNRYDYSKVEYVNNSTKVCIICPEHGEFWQTPNNHNTSRQGCPKCKGRGTSQEEIIKKFKEIHGDKYDYSKVEFHRVDEKVCIICPIHGEFWQEPRLHLNGMGCKYCAGKNMDTKEFIRRSIMVHGNKYDYSKVEFKNSKSKVCIICPKHGEFWQTPNNHLTGYGCKKCGSEIVHSKRCKNNDLFLAEAKTIHGDKYDYSKVEYYNTDTKVCIICPEHGEFWQTPAKHIKSHQGCPKCKSSFYEEFIRNSLKNKNIIFFEQQTFDWLRHKNKLYLDFYLPAYNAAIECQGAQHFKPVDLFGGEETFKKQIERDQIKYDLCKEHGISIFYFGEYLKEGVFNDFNNLLRNILNETSSFKTNRE